MVEFMGVLKGHMYFTPDEAFPEIKSFCGF